MTNPSAIVRSLMIWIIIVPIGLMLGYSMPNLTNLELTDLWCLYLPYWR